MFKKYHKKYAAIIGIAALSIFISNSNHIKAANNNFNNNINNCINNSINKTGTKFSQSELFNPYIKQAVKKGNEIPEIDPAATPQPTDVPVSKPDKVITSSSSSSTETDITISWDAVSDAEGYELELTYKDISYNVETTDNTYRISSLDTATICTYQIRYFKTILGEKVYSDMSEVFSAATSVGKTTGLSITNRDAQTADSAVINISWDKMNDASYKVYYKASSETEYKLSGETSNNSYDIQGLKASEKYDVYVQAYCLDEDNTGENSETISIYTCPAIVENFTIVNEESHKVELSWNENNTGNSFYIYRSVDDADYELYKITTETTLTETELTAGTVYSYMICSYSDKTNLTSPVTEPLRAVTTPYVTTGLKLSDNTASSIHLSWDFNETATGYIIYRRKGSGEFSYIGSTTETSYTDTELTSGKNYRYKIMTYADTEAHTSDFGEVCKTSTLPAQVDLSNKAGYGKLRLKWKSVSGAAGYYIYQQINDNFVLIDTIKNVDKVSKVYENLVPGETYIYKVSAYRIAFEQEFVSEDSVINKVTPRVTKGTTTVPSYYKTKKALINSDAWKKISIVKKYANYNKSYTIPGIRSTNVDGFESTSMCPQGLTFTKNYMLISSYDTFGEEKSVIYVMDKSTKELLTVIILPNKTHAGGITFDGENVWVTNGEKICTIDFNEIITAAEENSIYKSLSFSGIYDLGEKASFLTYYKNQIWTGNFENTENGKLRSYIIEKNASTEDNSPTDNTEEPLITLKKQSSVTIPPAVQGVTFSGNNLILSRAYGYTSELNIYKPSNIGKTNMKIGKIKKTVKMPALNEEIAVSGNYIYVNFESALPDSKALNHMDRVLAIKLKAVLK